MDLEIPDTIDKFCWHFATHESQNKQLRFYLLTISANYDRDKLFKSFKQFCLENQIYSLGLFEVYGGVDVIAKLWIPRLHFSQVSENFLKWSKAIDEDITVNATFPIDISTCIHHWLWDAKIEASDEIQVDLNFLNESLGKIGNPEESEESLVDELIERNLLRPKDNHAPAIRFIITVSSPTQATMPQKSKERYVTMITDRVKSAVGIANTEIYESEVGEWLLIDARAEFPDYPCIHQLVASIHETGVGDFGSRTTTFLCSTNTESVIEKDHIGLLEKAERPTTTNELLLTYLSQNEDKNLEVKGSLRTDLYEYLKTGQIKTVQDVEDKILKTISAFLNTAGGTLIIGAIEPHRFKDYDLTNLLLVGDHRICGIDPQLQKDGFDTFKRTVDQLIGKKIGSRASKIVTVVEFQMEGKSICVIDVPKSTSRQYFDGEIYVREGSNTKKLSAKEVSEYFW